MEQSSLALHKCGTVILLDTQTCISFIIWCVWNFIRIVWSNFWVLYSYCVVFCFVSSISYITLMYTLSHFILIGFNYSPKVDHWIIHQLFNLNFSSYCVHGTQTYTIFNIFDTQYSMRKTSQCITTMSGSCPRNCQS